MNARLAALGAVLIVAVPLVASAQNAATTAQGLLREGVEFRRQGRDQEALERFQRAHERSPSGNTLGQMGLAEQAVGRWLDAERHVREALAAGDAWVERNRAALQTAYVVIETHVGTLEVHGEPVGAEVSVDGVSVGRLPLAEAVHALVGSVRLEVRADGRESISRRVEILAGQMAREEVALAVGRVADVAPSGTPRTPPRPGGIEAGHVLVGVGVLGGVIGAVAWGISATVPAGCVRDGAFALLCDAGAPVASAASWIAVVGGGVGATSLVIGTVMLVTRGADRRVTVMPMRDGVVFVGRF